MQAQLSPEMSLTNVNCCQLQRYSNGNYKDRIDNNVGHRPQLKNAGY